MCQFKQQKLNCSHSLLVVHYELGATKKPISQITGSTLTITIESYDINTKMYETTNNDNK